MRDRSHDEAMAELYAADPALAIELLNSILDDGDATEITVLMRQLGKAGEFSITQGNALFEFAAIVKSLGLRLTVDQIADLDAFHLGSTHKAA